MKYFKAIPEGTIYGQRKVIKDLGMVTENTGNVRHYVRVQCSCGKTLDARATEIKKRTMCNSCGQKKYGHRDHGKYLTGAYRSWVYMKGRCLNPNNTAFKHYGGRGIKICDRWVESFKNFYEDMGEKPSSKHSIDRIDVNGDYEPGNCRWVTMAVQVSNRREKLHCIRGHKYTAENTAVTKQGFRICKICRRELWHRNKRRQNLTTKIKLAKELK